MATAFINQGVTSFTKLFRRTAGSRASATTRQQIRALLATHGRLTTPVHKLGDRDDLFAAGLRSFAAVQVCLAIEDTFTIEMNDTKIQNLDTILSISEYVFEKTSPDSV